MTADKQGPPSGSRTERPIGTCADGQRTCTKVGCTWRTRSDSAPQAGRGATACAAVTVLLETYTPPHLVGGRLENKNSEGVLTSAADKRKYRLSATAAPSRRCQTALAGRGTVTKTSRHTSVREPYGLPRRQYGQGQSPPYKSWVAEVNEGQIFIPGSVSFRFCRLPEGLLRYNGLSHGAKLCWVSRAE